jgi:predicted O-linked N-acetylglucosamine transferase (SPINDLY family)
VSGSILTNMDMKEYICNSVDEYKRKVLEYCENFNRDVHVQNRLRETIHSKFMELMDTKRFMSEYENIM